LFDPYWSPITDWPAFNTCSSNSRLFALAT
jgi:hypothetical protein